MSSDYRPRGASGGSSAGGSGGRRRRGGRGRGGHSFHGENRVHTNGGPSAAPKKEKSLLGKLFGWLSPKKSKPEAKQPFRTEARTPRPEFKERTPQAERVDRPRRDAPKAEPTPQEITSPKLYVGNLAYEASEGDLFDLFSKYGEVKNVEIAMDRHSQRSKGFGFVEMQVIETAKEAAAKLNRTDFLGRQIVVSGAKVDKRPAPSPRDPDPTAHDHEPEAHQPETHQPETGSSPDATA